MEKLLIAIMAVATFAALKMNVSELADCHSGKCFKVYNQKSKDILKVNWKPISVFPEEARRFNQH